LEIFLCHHADCLSFLAFCFSRLISLSSIGWSKEIDEPPFLWLLATGLKTYAHRFFYTISLFFPLSNLDGLVKSLFTCHCKESFDYAQDKLHDEAIS